MSTTDANGIVFLEETDAISPFHTLVNTLQSGTSAAVQNAANGPRYAANNTERDALLSTYGSSATNPLWVDVAGVFQRHNGTTWQVAGAALISGSWSTAAGWGVTTPTAARWHRQGPRGELESAIIQRTGSAISLATGTDYAVASSLPADLPLPSRPVYATGTVYFGTSQPWVVRFTVGVDGSISFRPETGGSFGVGGANAILMPAMSWVRDH